MDSVEAHAFDDIKNIIKVNALTVDNEISIALQFPFPVK